jgi:hypothetical protein
MEVGLRELVRRRAGDSCEYCRLLQSAAPFLTFHIEHIRARQHGGTDDPANLALACPDCNAHKGPNLSGVDPASGETARLFNPRVDRWQEHFAVSAARIEGSTAVGRATVAVLRLNAPERIEMRTELQKAGLI